jgi:hypothetical protein
MAQGVDGLLRDKTRPGADCSTAGGGARARGGTMIDDYKRHGATTLFAALNVLESKIIRRCMQHHRHQEFIAFSIRSRPTSRTAR